MLSDPHVWLLLSSVGGQHRAFSAGLFRMIHWKPVPLRAMDHTLMLSTLVPVDDDSEIHHSGCSSSCTATLCIFETYYRYHLPNIFPGKRHCCL